LRNNGSGLRRALFRYNCYHESKGVITYVNPAIERALGFKVEERIGAKGFERIHPDDLKFATDAFNTLAGDTNAPVLQSEIRLRHKNGSWRTFEAVGSNWYT